jgi:C-terminal processing protease CtpA/Prc
MTAGSGWIYPTSIGYIRLNQNQQNLIRDLRAKLEDLKIQGVLRHGK